MNKIVPQQFMLVTKPEREHIAKVFNLPRTGISEIRDTELIADGHTLEDLSLITESSMSEYVGSMESFGRLWELTIAKAHSELNPPVGVIGKFEEAPIVQNPTMTLNATPEHIKEIKDAPSVDEVSKKKAK